MKKSKLLKKIIAISSIAFSSATSVILTAHAISDIAIDETSISSNYHESRKGQPGLNRFRSNDSRKRSDEVTIEWLKTQIPDSYWYYDGFRPVSITYSDISYTNDQLYLGQVHFKTRVVPDWVPEDYDCLMEGLKTFQTVLKGEEYSIDDAFPNLSVGQVTDEQIKTYITNDIHRYIQDLPLDFTTENIQNFRVINSLESGEKTVTFNLKNYIDSSHTLNNGTLPIKFKLTGFVQSNATLSTLTYSIKDLFPDKIATEINEEELTNVVKQNYMNIFTNLPEDFTAENIVRVTPTENNNLRGSINIDITLNNYYNKDGVQVKGEDYIFKTTLDNIQILQTELVTDTYNISKVFNGQTIYEVDDEKIKEWVIGNYKSMFRSLPLEFDPKKDIVKVVTNGENVNEGTKKIVVYLNNTISSIQEIAPDNTPFYINLNGFRISHDTVSTNVHIIDINDKRIVGTDAFREKTLNEVSETDIKEIIKKNLRILFSNMPSDLGTNDLDIKLEKPNASRGDIDAGITLKKRIINGVTQSREIDTWCKVSGFKTQIPTSFKTITIDLGKSQPIPADKNHYKNKVEEYIKDNREHLGIPKSAEVKISSGTMVNNTINYPVEINQYYDDKGNFVNKFPSNTLSVVVGPFDNEKSGSGIFGPDGFFSGNNLNMIFIISGSILGILILILIIILVRKKRKYKSDAKKAAKLKDIVSNTEFDQELSAIMAGESKSGPTYYTADSSTRKSSAPSREQLEKELAERIANREPLDSKITGNKADSKKTLSTTKSSLGKKEETSHSSLGNNSKTQSTIDKISDNKLHSSTLGNNEKTSSTLGSKDNTKSTFKGKSKLAG